VISFRFESDSKKINAKLARLASSQIPFAASKALNQTAVELKDFNRIQMMRRFDKPVKYTLNAFMVERSNKRSLSAAVRRKDKPSGRHYLEIQATGGPRPRKGVEKMMEQRIAYGGILRNVLPTTKANGATRAGGINMGEVHRAMAGLGASYATTAYTRDKQRAAESKRSLQKRPTQYFVAKPNTGKNKTGGIYKRSAGGKKVTKVFHFLESSPQYTKRLPFKSYMTKQAKLSFPKNLKREMRAALRTAKFR
jgi:hypothetical protein